MYDKEKEKKKAIRLALIVIMCILLFGCCILPIISESVMKFIFNMYKAYFSWIKWW